MTHVNKRLKSRANIILNLENLLVVYNQHANSSFLINFAIIYISLGFSRLSIEKQTELASLILNCLEDKPEPHQDKLIMLILPLLGELKVPDNPEERSKLFGLSDKSKTRQHLLGMLLDVLLIPYGITDESDIPPGMSTYSFKRCNLDNKKAEYLETLKKGIVKFITSGVVSENEIISHLIVSSADTRFSVATPALNELNKICTSLDWFDPKISTPLYLLFSGNGSKIPDRKTSGCNTRVKQKILQHLLKCRGPALNVGKGIQVIFEGIFGETTNQKCKVLALQFASNLISNGQKDLIEKISKVLVSGINKLIGTESAESMEVQNAAFNAISKLVAVVPSAFDQNVSLIVSYFKYLNESPPELHNSIREVLIALAQAFKYDPANDKEEPMELDEYGKIEKKSFIEKFSPNSNHLLLLGVLTEQCESRLPIAQNICSFFLTTCFPSHFVASRYLLLVLSGTCLSLRETITAYLYGQSKKDHIDYSSLISADFVDEAEKNQKLILPGFKPMIHYIWEIAEKKLPHGSNKLAFSIDVYTELLEYLRFCLWYSAGCKSEPGSESEMHLLRNYIMKLNEFNNIGHVENYLRLIRNIVISKKGFIELSCLSDLLNSAPEIVVKENSDMVGILSPSLKEINETTRTLIAQIYGILVAYGTKDADFKEEVTGLLNLSQKSLEYQHGSVMAISNVFYHRIKFLRTKKNEQEVETLIKSKEFTDTIQLFIKLLTDLKSLLTLAAIKGLSLIGSLISLPLEEVPDKEEASETMEVDDPVNSKNYLFRTVFHLLKSSQTKQKVREESAHCLGNLAIGDHQFFSKRVLLGFLDLKRMTKDAALHIAIAQGMNLAVDSVGDEKTGKDELLEWLLDELIKIVPEINVCSRQYVSLCLLALVKNCVAREPVIKKRRILQMAFTTLLGDDSELILDVASRALGIIYSMSDESSQAELSTLLLDQLTDGRRAVQKVSDDTVLFEEGVLGKTPTGSNISTYKELCSLASDLNQPDMIYQFMQIANHNANYNSKLGAAFGLQSISGITKEKMQPYLKKIVPRLFRYKYDPTPKIQNSMISIWDSVVVDNKQTLELYYWDILDDVITNLVHNEWRTRIACCLAVRDLIRRPTGLRLRCTDPKTETEKIEEEKMEVDDMVLVPEPELRQLWINLFKTMDDIQEGVREAAGGTCNVLAKLCIVSVSADHGKSGGQVASSVLPFLLKTGVTHTVPEIRKLSIKTLSEMIDSAGSLIVPHLPELIPCLLKATGELDSTKLSHLSSMVSGQSGTQEAVDSVRAEFAKSHYTMETLIKCIKYIDYPTLEKTTPLVLDVLKSSPNLGTKIATAHFICLISVHLSSDLTPLAGKYLNASLAALTDRNTTVRKYFASAIGHLIGIAKEQTVTNLFKKLTSFYFEEQSNKSRAIALTLNAINKKHSDIIKDYSSTILPLIFFAKHEEINEDNKNTVEMFEELWSDINFGDSMLHAQLNDIIIMLENCLNSQSWILKAQSGNTLKTVGKRLDSRLSVEERTRLIDLVLNAVSGRTFAGKERLVEALATLCPQNSENKDVVNRIVAAILRECRKEEPIYKTKVLKCLGEILEKMEEENRFEDVYNLVFALLDKQSISERDDSESAGTSSNYTVSNEERNKDKVVLINLKEVVCETLGKSWPSVKALNSWDTQQKYQLMLIEKLTACLSVNTRPIQVSLLVALQKYLEKLYLLNESEEIESKEKKVKSDDAETLHKIVEYVLINVSEASGK